jgi:signal transduction histidine kinase
MTETESDATDQVAAAGSDASVALMRRYLEHAPAASALVSGAAHGLVLANAAFRRLAEDGGVSPDIGLPVADTMPAAVHSSLTALLDRVRRDGVTLRDTLVQPTSMHGARRPRATWCCDIWPVVEDAGRLDFLVLTLRPARRRDETRARQRAITERLLLTALREQERARRADSSRARAVFLSDASRRLSASLEQEAAYLAVTRVTLPSPGAWSIVDVAQVDGSWRRLNIVHPDPVKNALARELDAHWSPAPGDPFGAPLVAESRQATAVPVVTDAALTAAAHGADNRQVLLALDLGSLLVVPIMAHDQLYGAITFVAPTGGVHTADDVAMAQDLAFRCADVLDAAGRREDAQHARLEADAARDAADLARKDAEHANEVKTAFLTSMSHELRTPLTAILGYSELLTLGLRGPVTPDQQDMLGRIRRAGRHLLDLINDVLDFAKLKASEMRFTLTTVLVGDVFESAKMMVEPQVEEKGLELAMTASSTTLSVNGDRDKVLRILLNLLSNAIKFTDRGGSISLAAAAVDRRWRTAGAPASAAAPTGQRVRFTVTDTGRGIAADQLRMIFEPFVQVGQRLTGMEVGTGLGLAISRQLARGMGGDLTVESTLGAGSMFTLTMPCAAL